jgi:hypothetical protein
MQTHANAKRTTLFTAGLSKALRRRVIFRTDNTQPTSMEAVCAEANQARVASAGFLDSRRESGLGEDRRLERMAAKQASRLASSEMAESSLAANKGG